MEILSNTFAFARAIDAGMDACIDTVNKYSRTPTKVVLWGYIALGVAGGAYLGYQAAKPVVASGVRQVRKLFGDTEEVDGAEVVNLRQAA